MYHDPQNYNNNPPPLSQPPTAHYQPNPHNQPWHQPTHPQPQPNPTGLQFPSSPPLPPKPGVNTHGFPSWGGDQVSHPMIMTPGPPPHGQQWAQSPDHNQRAYSVPAMTAVPRIGNMIPPEHVRALDAGKYQGPESSIPPTRPQFHVQYPSSSFTPSPSTPMPHTHTLAPQMFSQTGASPPRMNNWSPRTPGSPPGDVVRARAQSQSYFNAPPPPPPINRGHTPVPPPNPHPPLPPHPHHGHSEPQVPTMQHLSAMQPRQQSFPVYPPPPGTPAPNLLPPVPPTPAPPTHIPSFPMPFGAPTGPVRTDGQSWVGGIAPRSSMHFKPSFQPDWSHMPPIQQATPMGQRPQPHLPPPPPPPPPPTLQMPVPIIGATGAPPVPPPPPRHAVTSPTVLTHGQWSDGLNRSGTVTANRPPLPPKEPVSPPNELPLPPKVPIVPPKEVQPTLPSTSTAGSSPAFVNSPLVMERDHDEDELREALRQSLADSAGVRGTDEEDELRRALAESMREASLGGSGFDSMRYDSPRGLDAVTPVLRPSPPPERDPRHSSRPAPVSSHQEAGPSTLRRTSGPSTHASAPLLISTTDPPPAAPVESATSSPAVLVHENDEGGADELPPPAYEEVTNSATHSPAIAAATVQPPAAVEPPARSSSSGPVLGAVSRSPSYQGTNNVGESRSLPQVIEPPVIEVVPPSHHNSLSRPQREPEQPAPQPVERIHNGSSPTAQTPHAWSPPTRSEANPRSATASPPVVPRPRAISQARLSSDTHPLPEQSSIGTARQRVMSASHVNTGSISRRSRASMFFGMPGSSSSSSTENPRRTWAIDEEPSKNSGSISLQPPEPPGAISRLQSRNASKANLQESQADAPPVDNLLNGVSYGFREPDSPTPVPVLPAEPLPPSVMIGENMAFHIQAPNFRHLLRLLSHCGSTNIMATPAAIAASKSGKHSTRVVLYFVRGNHERDPWLCRLFLELHTPGANDATPVADTSELWEDTCIQALSSPRGKLYVVPGPLPELPLTFQGLSTFLVTRLESATRASSDNLRRLERILVECYGSVAGSASAGDEIGGRQKGSGNLSIGGLFSRVKDKFTADKGGTLNDHTYDLISPFQIDEYR